MPKTPHVNISNGCALFLCSLCISAISAADDVVLPVIRLTGTSTEALLDDGTVPPDEVSTRSLESRGSSARALAQRASLSITDYGKAGTLTQLRGVGRSADEVNVEALGVPLNPPQGGGFDFTSFPSFFWSSVSYRPTPGAGAYNPRATAGVAALVPWTAAALETEGSGFEFKQSFSGSGIRQTSVGIDRRREFGLLAGLSDGKVSGPTGSISVRTLERQGVSAKIHLLGTAVKASSPGSASAPSPRATTLFQRLIPVAELSQVSNEEHQWRSTAFYDWSRIQYHDPDHPTYGSNDRARQYGAEGVLLSGRNKWGAGARRVSFDRLDFSAPPEWVGHLTAARAFGAEQFRLTPEVRIVGVSRMGLYPAASIAQRSRLSEVSGIYSKVSYSETFPSMNDRFYSSPFFIGNSQLRPERDWSALLGFDFTSRPWRLSTEFFHQQRFQSLVQGYSSTSPGLLTMQNSNRAWIQTLREKVEYEPSARMRATATMAWTRSRIVVNSVDFPYQPEWLGTAGLAYSPTAAMSESRVELETRFLSSQAVSSRGDRIGGYATLDLSAGAQLSRWQTAEQGAGLFLDLRIDNIFDRRFEAIRDFPSEGRVLSVALTGRL